MSFSPQPLTFPVKSKGDWIGRELTILNGTGTIDDSSLLVDLRKGNKCHCVCGVKGNGKSSLLNKLAYGINAQGTNLIAVGPISTVGVTFAFGRYDASYVVDSALRELNFQFPDRITLPEFTAIPERFDQFSSLLETLSQKDGPNTHFLFVLDDLDGVSKENRALVLSDLKTLIEAESPRIRFLFAGDFLADEFPSLITPLDGMTTGYLLGAFTPHEMDEFLAKATKHSRLQFDAQTRQVFKNWTQSVPFFCQVLMMQILEQGFPDVPDWSLTPSVLENTARNTPPIWFSSFLLPLTSLTGRARGDTQELLNMLLQSDGQVDAANIDWDYSVVRDLWRRGIIWRNARNDSMVWASPLLERWFQLAGPVIDNMPWGAGPPRDMEGPPKATPPTESRPEKQRRGGRRGAKKGRPPTRSAMKGPPPESPNVIERYVNLWFTQKRDDDQSAISKDQALAHREKVYLHVNIAPFDERSILEDAEPFVSDAEIARRFPETVGKPVPLEVTLFSRENEFYIAPEERIQKLDLVAGKPTRSLYFLVSPLRMPVSQLRVCVFYRNHLLQSLNVTVVVDSSPIRTPKAQRAQLEMSFSAGFSQVQALPPRGLWLGLNRTTDGTHTLNLKNSDRSLSRSLESKIEHALIEAREALLKVSFVQKKDDEGKPVLDEETGLPKKEYRFNADNFPKTEDPERRTKRFKEDLTILAAAGSNLYQAVFGQVPTAEERDEVQPLVDELKRTLRNEQVIQVARLKAMEDIWPWAVMYDSVIDSDRVKDVCLSFRGDGGRALPYTTGVAGCMHRDPQTRRNRDKTVVCPYSFWGFKHIIEQPVQPGGKRAFSDLITEIKIGADPILQMPVENRLSRIEATHITDMQNLRFKMLPSLEEITAAVMSEPHVLYFFCHGKYDSQRSPYLQVGADQSLLPSELDDLDFNWATSHGLVFINGCHTAELQPKDLASIMAPFVKAYASGIIGTEISVTTALAREVAREFFKRFLGDGLQGQTVGQIIKELRLDLLMKYNPLGLVYTPYCSADLRVVH